jgi:hypothetical protein
MKQNLAIFLIIFCIFLVALLAGIGLYFARRILISSSSEGDTTTITATLESGSSGSESS